MAHPARSELDKALAALERDEGPAALEALLRAWRLWPATRLADLIDAHSKQTPSRPLTAQTPKALEVEWLERAARCDPLDVRALLAHPWPAHARQSEARFKAWAKLPADPRVFRFGRELLKNIEGRSNSALRVHRWWWETALEANDPEAGAKLAEAHQDLQGSGYLMKGYYGGFAAFATSLVAKYPRPPQPPEDIPELTDALDQLEQTLRRGTSKLAGDATREKLFAAVYQNPADDAARLVLADWLLEQGDPRGEFIHLQIRAARGQTTEHERRRMGSLARAGGATWLDGLEPDVYWQSRPRPRFERGFAVAVTLAPDRELRTLRHPAWATLEVIRLGPPASQALFGNANLASLKEVHGVTASALRRLAGHPVPLRKVTLVVSLDEPIAAAPAIDALRLAGMYLPPTPPAEIPERIPAERALAWLSTAPFWRSLKELEWNSAEQGGLDELWRLAPSLPSNLHSAGIEWCGDWHLKLSRDQQGAFTRLHAVYPLQIHIDGLPTSPPLGLALDTLPADALTEFTYEQKEAVPERELSAIDTALRRQTRLTLRAILERRTGGANS